jgi:hypothetical protein
MDYGECGLNRLVTRVGGFAVPANNDNVAGKLGIGGVSTDPLDFGFPAVSIPPDYTAVSDPSNPFPTFRKDNVYQAGDTVSVIRGAHAFKFGGLINLVQVNGVQNSFGRGSFEFDGRFTSLKFLEKSTRKQAYGPGFRPASKCRRFAVYQ